jgi:hypothetical protein
VADDKQSADSLQAQNNEPRNIYERAKEYYLTSAETYEAFRPNDHITRAEMAKIITSYMQSSLRGLVSS